MRAVGFEDLEWLERQVRINYFKRIQAPPVIVLSKRAFGFDLRETQQPPYAPRRCEQLKAEALKVRDLSDISPMKELVL